MPRDGQPTAAQPPPERGRKVRMEPRISLITLGIDDLDREVAFYEALGWPAPQRPDDEVAFFQAGGMVFALWTGVSGRGASGVELAYNVRDADEVAPVLAAAVAAGGSVVRPAEVAEWGGTSGAFADPEGYVWEVAHNPAWTIGADGSITM
jgi:predicted enzyme related to lactoylglutathione lyase